MPMVYAFRPLDPTTYPQNIALRAPETLKTWLKFFPGAQPKNRDEEDWIENAVILESADKAGLKITMLESKGNNFFVSGMTWNVPEAKENAPYGVMLGHWTNKDMIHGLPMDIKLIGTNARSVKIAGQYYNSKTFMRYAGRPIIVTSGDVTGEDGIEAGLRKIVEETGSSNIFMKTVFKGWSTSFDIDKSAESYWHNLCDQDLARGEESVGLGWFPVEHEGSKNRFMIQGRITPRYEYRFAIINGKPVTGSGCVEAFTPAENTAVFDPQMEAIRNKSHVESREDLVEAYLEFAEMFCREFAEEHGEGLDYSLDVCIDQNSGNIVPIELNPPLNLGAYARNTDAWMKAIVDRAAEYE